MSFSMIPSCRSLGSALVSADRGGTVRVWIVFCTGLLAGCVGESSLPAVSGPYDQAFSEEFRVELDTIPVATMGQVSEVLVLDDRILVTDQMSDRVVAFSLEGAFAGAVGRHGEGPGEFQNPRSLVEASDGTILVSDVSPRLTRLGTSLEVLDVFTVPEWPWVGRLDRVGEDVILFQPSNRSEGENFHRWSIDDGLEGAFDRRSDLVLSVPYWNATWTTHLAASADHIVVADNMIYPMRLYSPGWELRDTVGSAPPSWRQARKPYRGEFTATGAAQVGVDEWFRSFDVIDGIFVIDEHWLIVTHRRRVNEYRTDDEIRADVYVLDSDVRKVWEDVRLPGPILRGGGCAWMMVGAPPDPWTLACVEPRNP